MSLDMYTEHCKRVSKGWPEEVKEKFMSKVELRYNIMYKS